VAESRLQMAMFVSFSKVLGQHCDANYIAKKGVDGPYKEKIDGHRHKCNFKEQLNTSQALSLIMHQETIIRSKF